MVLDNLDVAILQGVNELSVRYGLRPYDFVATIKSQGHASALCFEIPVAETASGWSRFCTMIESIGVAPGTGILVDSKTSILEAVDKALDLAPKSRTR